MLVARRCPHSNELRFLRSTGDRCPVLGRAHGVLLRTNIYATARAAVKRARDVELNDLCLPRTRSSRHAAGIASRSRAVAFRDQPLYAAAMDLSDPTTDVLLVVAVVVVLSVVRKLLAKPAPPDFVKVLEAFECDPSWREKTFHNHLREHLEKHLASGPLAKVMTEAGITGTTR